MFITYFVLSTIITYKNLFFAAIFLRYFGSKIFIEEKKFMRKRFVFLASLLAISTLAFATSCGDPNPVDPTTYTVSFNSNGGSAVEDVEVEGGALLVEPTDPTKDGYVFDGWYEDQALTIPFDFDEVITSNMTLFAKWRYYYVNELISLAANYPDGASEDRFYVEATIDSVDDPYYGEMTISDDTGTILVYGTYDVTGEIRYGDLEDKPVAGDSVVLYANVTLYETTPEIHSGWIVSFVHNTPIIDPNEYQEMSILEARNAPTGTLVKIDGVVARFTYNNSLNPIGFILVDETNSIYVYDSQIAPQLTLGNHIEIAAKRDNWILDNEQANAETYGYDGCIQVIEATLISNDEGNNDFDTSWISDSTVKTLMDHDISESNFTTSIYRVNALIEEKEGSNFTNFYFFDIDGTTGSYAYSQASGRDFDWLREFDGKICEVYLTVLNYKSEQSGLIPRFLPIKVTDNNYQFDLATTPNMVLTYYVDEQFAVDYYYSDPNLALVTSVSNDLLGFENALVTYTSSNNAAIYFEEVEGVTYMHVNTSVLGTFTVNAKVTYASYEATKEYHITVSDEPMYETITISEAIDAELNSEVTLRGIVLSALVNQKGFYLTDDHAIIAIQTTADSLKTISVGDEVIVRGIREQYDASGNIVGQCAITNGEILSNLYGDNEIPSSFYIQGQNLAYINSLSVSENHTNEVYIIEAKFIWEDHGRYTTCHLEDESGEGQLYTSSANQYSWLQDYNEQTLTYAVAPCNWNTKSFYKLCVIYVQLADGTIIYNDGAFSY